MSDIEQRVKQLEEAKKGFDTDHNSLMRISTKVDMLDPTAIIEFKAVAVDALRKISEDLAKLETGIQETKDLVSGNKEAVLTTVNEYRQESNKNYGSCDKRITVLQAKAAGWGSLGGTAFGIIASWFFKLLVG